MIWRYYDGKISELIAGGKLLVIYGPRQVGKTTLINSFLKGYEQKYFQATGDDATLREIMGSQELSKIKTYFEEYDLVFIDEAQRINEIGYALKLMVDHLPELKIIATGSSSFGLASQVGEPLVGRQNVLRMYPIALLELKKEFGNASILQNLDEYLIYGLYPEVLTTTGKTNKINYLNQLRDGYLFKDILEMEKVRNADKILDLLRLLAFQIGQEVSIQELGKQLGMSKNTVERYLELLQKAFVLVKLSGFSRNLRKEVSKTSRYYFYDNGVRNAIIGNFNFPKMRDDMGKLWENFMVIERMKKRTYHQVFANQYFWRTYDQKEIDLIEERDGKLFGYEFKYKPKKQAAPKVWKEAYKNSAYQVIHKENFLDFVL